MVILKTVKNCIEEVSNQFNNDSKIKYMNQLIKGIGITNQRETTIVWDKYSGKPLYNAIGIIIYVIYPYYI